jgi:hypothetical protein
VKLLLSVLVVFTLASTATATAQTNSTTSSFLKRLEQSRSTLQVDAMGLHGPGAAVIGEAVKGARYVLIGEDHLSKEIPQFTIGTCRLMASEGLDALAVEIGPEAAHVVNQNLRQSDRVSQMSRFMHAHPDAFAFQNGKDESDMAAQCAVLAGKRFQVWGLDQEFFGASGYLLEEMIASHPGPLARQAIEKLESLDRTATAEALESGSPSKLLVFKISDKEIAKAAAGIGKDGSDETKSLFGALEETRAIYLGQYTDGFASNRQRALLMKRTLVHYLDERPTTSRVLFKFGDVHMAKGFNDLGQRDVGNFVAERADGEGATSLHMAVYGAKGIHALYNGVGRQVRQEPFVLEKDADYAFIKDALTIRDQARAGNEWEVIDLRLLRTHLPSQTSRAWRQMIERYDLLVIAPYLTPSTLMGAR